MNMSLPESRKLKPVLRRPRKNWRIPPVDAAERLLKQQQEEARNRAFCKGTTSTGRECLRRAIFSAEQLIAKGQPLNQDSIDAVQSRFADFNLLKPEFAKLVSRIWAVNEERWLNAPSRDFATLILMRTSLTLSCKSQEQHANLHQSR
jgi:hypothetical protein